MKTIDKMSADERNVLLFQYKAGIQLEFKWKEDRHDSWDELPYDNINMTCITKPKAHPGLFIRVKR